MKKDRNCSMPYPIYPPYQGMPMQSMPMQGMPMQGAPIMNNQMGGSIEQQISSMNNQINNLEKRVSTLENLVGNKYNPSNFQIM